MPTRKQRARRAKSFRHEYGFVVRDEEGNEVEVDRSELRPDRKESSKSGSKPGAKAGGKSGRGSGRVLREPPAPSWNRAVRRGLIWGGPMIVLFILVFRSAALVNRVEIGVLYAIMFIPLTYVIDGYVYRRYMKRNPGARKP